MIKEKVCTRIVPHDQYWTSDNPEMRLFLFKCLMHKLETRNCSGRKPIGEVDAIIVQLNLTEDIPKTSFSLTQQLVKKVEGIDFSQMKLDLNFASDLTELKNVMRCGSWYHVYNLKNVKNTHGRVLILVKLQTSACNFTKINTRPWVVFTFFKLYKWYQLAQHITDMEIL